MKVVFIVQGEGRGHLTQALSMLNILQNTRYEVCGLLIGKSLHSIPNENIINKLGIPVKYFNSPSLTYKASGEGIDVKKTIVDGLKNATEFLKSLKNLKEEIEKLGAELVINFYDVLGGLYKLVFPFSSLPMVCVGHQYLMLHPAFQCPKSKYLARFLVNLNTKITAIGAEKIMALSLDKLQPKGKISIIAPLLRPEIKLLQTSKEGYFIAYLTNSCLLKDLRSWQAKHPEFMIHCFCKTESEEEFTELQPNFYLHPINPRIFLDKMAKADALLSSAGFESICEAIYLDKPVFMVPIPNHFEQSANAHDFYLFGAGLKNIHFDLDNFLPFLHDYNLDTQRFRQWSDSNAVLVINQLDELAIKPKKIKNSLKSLAGNLGEIMVFQS